MAYKFEIHKDKTGQFRARFKYSGEVIFATEAYTTKASAQKAIKSIKEKGPAAPIEDLTLAVPAKTAAKTEPSTKRAMKSTAAKVAAKPVAAVKAAAKAVSSAVETAVKTPAKRKT